MVRYRRGGRLTHPGARAWLPESRAPTFVRGYSARQAFAKALPILTLVFVVEILNALNLEFGFWANVGFLAGGIVLALGAVGLLNVWRGQPFLSPHGGSGSRYWSSSWSRRCCRSSSAVSGRAPR